MNGFVKKHPRFIAAVIGMGSVLPLDFSGLPHSDLIAVVTGCTIIWLVMGALEKRIKAEERRTAQ